MPASGSRTHCASRAIARARAPYTREEKGGELVLTFTIARGPLHRDRIGRRPAGNASIAAADLAPLLQIKPGDPFVEARAGLVAAAMAELYRVRGFAQAAVKPDHPGAAGGTGRRRDVSAGRRFGSRSTKARRPSSAASTFEGNTAIAAADAAGADGAAGRQAVLSAAAVRRSRRDRTRLPEPGLPERLGHLAADVRRTISSSSALAWTIREGDQVKVDHVLITGNSRISTDLIRRELTIRPGDPMSDEAMLESQRAWQRSACSAASASPSCRAPARSRATSSSRSRRPRRRPSITAAASRSAASPSRPTTAAARSISSTSARAASSRSAAATCGARTDR